MVVSIVEVSPNRGAPGTLVKIFGADFGSGTGQNKVAFARPGRRGGISAVVTSAAANLLVVRVPPGATTGTISVSCPNGSATSAQPFVVTAPDSGRRGPAISEFSPGIATPGTEVTLKGAGFDGTAANNRVMFNNAARAPVISAVPTALVVSVPTGAGSGRVSVMTPDGTGASSRDFFIPPAPFTTADVAFAGRINVGGSVRAIALQRPEAFAMQLVGMILFDATAGQRLRLAFTVLTLGHGTIAVHGPDARPLGPPWPFTAGAEFVLEIPPLPTTGTYTIIVDPQGVQTGTVSLALSRAPV